MGDIVKFDKKSYSLQYDAVLLNDCYLRTTVLNGLKKAGYSLSKSGVKQFQHDHKLQETGILSINELPTLLLYFDSDTRQGIINYMEIEMKKSNNKKNVSSTRVIVALLLLLFFEAYGLISCFIDIIHLIKG